MLTVNFSTPTRTPRPTSPWWGVPVAFSPVSASASWPLPGRCFDSTDPDPCTAMPHDQLEHDLFSEICRIPLIDPHTHINPHQPTARSLDDILNYHYYTELAHSAGMDQGPLGAGVDPRERARSIL